ncbi:MAG: glycine cleavage system protein GcvH [Parvularcula sp.]
MTTKYTKDHEWARVEGDVAIIGITPHAAEQLGDVVFVELPEVGKTVDAHGDLAVVESVKAASDIYAPISGEVIAVNQEIADAPEKVNEDAGGAAWFAKIKMSNPSELEGLLDEAAYKEFVENG